MSNSGKPATPPKLRNECYIECIQQQPLWAAKAVYEWEQPQCGCLFLPAQQFPVPEPKNRGDIYAFIFNQLIPTSMLHGLKTLSSVHYTNHWAIKEANRVAWQNCGLYPSQVLLGICCGERPKFRQDWEQEGQDDQCCGCLLWSALQPALVHQGVTEGHYLSTKTTEQTFVLEGKSKRN